jgi:flagellar hook assembly protein FlgD
MPTKTPTVSPTVTSTTTPSDEFALSHNTYRSDRGDFRVRYKVSVPGKYSLRIYNSAGELVRLLRDLESRWPVEDTVPWDGRNEQGDPVASGVYIVYFESSRYTRTATFLVLH